MQTVQYKCPNCGASVMLDPESQRFTCEFCRSDFTQEEISAAVAQDVTEADKRRAAGNDFAEHTNLYICDSCGAEIVADENTAASFCHYCHGAVTLKGRVEGALQPDLIIPFKIDREKAEEAFKNWCGRKWFVPNSFRSQGQLEKMVGLYVPFWLADCDTDVSAEYEATKVNSHTSGNYRITHTKVYSVSRAARMTYKGIPADGSKKLDDKLMDAIEPFDYSGTVPFDMSWFSGFYADKYDVDKSAVLPRIKSRMEQGIRQYLDESVSHYTSKSCQSFNFRITNTNWHYAMLPVWFMTYIHSNKKYFFALNGQTGKIAGILPLSAVKLALLAAVIILIFTISMLFA